jgi:hypoxanthine phosphoribosyltransferase
MGQTLMGSIEYEVPTWNQIYTMLLEQSEKICKSCYQPDIIVGIARGGIIPMRILADLLKIHQVAIIRIESYEDIAKQRIQPALTHTLNVEVHDKKLLIVDDISDSGQSLKIVKQHLHGKGAMETKIATLYTKPTTQILPDYFEKTTNRWIVFPWELKETLQNIFQKPEDKQIINNEFNKLVKAGLPKRFLKQILKTILEPQI